MSAAVGWIAGEPGAVAWLVAVLLVVAIRAALVVIKRRRAGRATWCGRWFEASTAWPPRRGAGTGQVPPRRNPAGTQSDIGKVGDL